MNKQFKETTLIFLTAGEVPGKNNLISSQVLKLANYFNKKKIFKNIEYFGLVPRRYYLTSFLKRRKIDFSFLENFQFNTTLKKTNFILGGFLEFIFHEKFAVSDAKKVILDIESKQYDNIIFHCRSYYATNVAIEIRKILPSKSIKIVFDMRSLLPPEFYFMMGKKGKLLYSDAKEWEYYLLSNADISLMTTFGGIEFLKIENTKANIHYIPIMGLDTEDINIDDILEQRWNNKKLSYVGSVSFWHPLDMIEKSLRFFEKNIPSSKIEIVTNSSNIQTSIKTTTVEHSMINEYYINMLALVIPGRETNGYFESLQLSINLFSTKAAEAISVGVPLVVNEDIVELAEFVKTNKCGIIFKNTASGIELINCTTEDLQSKNFWEEITKNAYLVSNRFRFGNVEKQYLEYYKGIM